MRKWIVPAAVLALSTTVIFFKINQIPIHIANDEIAFVRLVLSLQNSSYQVYSPLETGHATLYFYVLLASFKLFGITLFALRFPAAIFGVTSSVILYLIFKEIWKGEKLRWLVPLLIFTFVTSRWFITFARFSFEATFLLLLEMVSILFFVKYEKTKKTRYLILTGIFVGLAFHSYTPGRIFFLVPLLSFWPASMNLKRGELVQNRTLVKKIRKLIFLLLPFILISLPLFSQISQTGDYRLQQESILHDAKMSPSTKLLNIGQNIYLNTSMLFYKGDMNGRHNYPGKPALNPILGLLFIAGVFVFIRSKKKTNYDYLFLIYFIVSLIPTSLTNPKENPNMLRTYTMLPAIMYFIGKGIMSFYDYCHAEFSSASRFNWIPKQVRDDFKTKYIPTLIILLLFFSSLYELRTYFIYQAKVSFYAFEVKKPFEWVKARNFKLVDDWYKP